MDNLNNLVFTGEKEKCVEFWMKLKEKMQERGYILRKFSIGTTAEYLFREGDEKFLTWRNKPRMSFRIADYWSWYANTKIYSAPTNYIQCLNVDFGWVKKRPDPVRGTMPRMGWAVAYTKDGYHYSTIFGKKYDQRAKKWIFITPTVDEALANLGFGK